MATIINIPREARQLTFQHLFQDATVSVSRDLYNVSGILKRVLSITKNFDDAVLYTCSQLYEEARATIALFLHMEFNDADTSDLPPAVASHYCSRVRDVGVMLGCDHPQLKTSPFTCLRTLTVQFDPYELPGPDSYALKPPTPLTMTPLIHFIQGSSDEEFKRSSWQKYLTHIHKERPGA